MALDTLDLAKMVWLMTSNKNRKPLPSWEVWVQQRPDVYRVPYSD